MNTQVSAPYNFVPLNEVVYCPEWANSISQDIPFEDGEDGWIEIVWKNFSPLCVRDASEKKDETDNKTPLHSMRIKDSTGNWHYFIPGSSLKGMLRSIMSVMSYGNFTQYDNKSFGQREIANKEYREKMSDVKFGWFLKDTNENYILRPCSEDVENIEIEELKKLYPEFDNEKSAWKRNEKIDGNTFPHYKKNGTVYRIFATGKMGGKKHELLIPQTTEVEEVVPKSVKDTFFSIYEVTPDFENYRTKIEEGQEIPVSFKRDKTGNIIAIGMGKMFRYPYKYDIKTLVGNSQDSQSYVGKHDLCETIFGWTDKNYSMKGRVQISNAFMQEEFRTNMQEVKGVFGTPKPSFYPFYLKQDSYPNIKNYDDNAKISGRKFYRIHKGNSTMLPPKGNKEDNKIETSFIPIPENNLFLMRINIHNLRKVEIGALLAAITFNHTEGAFHNIGAAKGFGYGKIKCEKIKLNGFKFQEEEYLKAFEMEMENFVREKTKEDYTSSNSIQTLIGIASEHQDKDVRQMEMKNSQGDNDFEACKKASNKLKELERKMNSYIGAKERFCQRHKIEFETLEKVIENLAIKDFPNNVRYFLNNIRHNSDNNTSCEKSIENYLVEIDNYIAEIEKKMHSLDSPKEVLSKLINEMILRNIDITREIEWMKIFEDLLLEFGNLRKELANTKDILLKEITTPRRLEDILNEKYPNKDEYKIKEWKVCKQKIEKWQRNNGLDKESNQLTTEEIVAVKNAVIRLYPKPDKKEAKKWKDFNSDIWKDICKYISQQEAEKIFKAGQP